MHGEFCARKSVLFLEKGVDHTKFRKKGVGTLCALPSRGTNSLSALLSFLFTLYFKTRLLS